MENKEKLVEFNNKLIELCKEYNVNLVPDLSIKIVPLQVKETTNENKPEDKKDDAEGTSEAN